MEIFDLKTFKRSMDSRLISVTFETDGAPLEIVANTGTLASVVQQIAGIVWEARRANPSTVLSIPTPSNIQAQPTKTGDGVVLRFQMSNRLEYLFALGTADAIQFRARLDKILSDQK